jgi:hypothetical protein
MSLAGESIDAYCPRCELLLAHVILFEVRGSVSRVKCRTCGTEHKYRGQKPQRKGTLPIRKIRSAGKSKESVAEKAGHAVDIQRWQATRDHLEPDAELMVYQTSDCYSKGDTINHDVFGMGFVEKIISATRMDVLFCDGIRRMAMNVKTMM